MRFGMIIIGDEILRRKRQDRHFDFVAGWLLNQGQQLAWCHIIGDDAAEIETQLARSMASNDVVFCFGGIGATPDDLTRACAARAAGQNLQPHPEAVKIIEEKYGPQARPARILMAELPEQARLIPNPVNQIPGFSLGDHHFVPGFPEMAQPMVKWVWDRYYAHMKTEPQAEIAVLLKGAKEGDLVPTMNRILQSYPDIKLSSLPRIDGGAPRIEFSLRGVYADIHAAFELMESRLDQLEIEWEEVSK